MAGFCGDPLWDSNVTWATDNPDFTECFQLTVLTWTPCIFLWIFTPLEIYFMLTSRYRDIPWSILNITKLLIVALLMIQSAVELGMAIDYLESQDTYSVHVVTPGIKLVTFMLLGILIYYQKKYGLHSSGIGFLFSFILMIFAIPQLRSEIMSETNSNGYNNFRYVSYSFYFPLVVVLFLLQCFADKRPQMSEFKTTEKECPVLRASYLSSLTFQWMDRFMYTGYKRPLTQDDMFDITPDEASRTLVPIFDKQWNRELEKSRKRQKKRGEISSVTDGSTLPVMLKGFFGPFWLCVLIRLFIDALNFSSPYLLRLLMAFTSNDDYLWKGFLYTAVFFLTSLLVTILTGQFNLYSYLVGFRIRSALISAIYRKSLRLSNSAKKQMSTGEVVNLMAVDAQRFYELTAYLHFLWSAPLVIIVCLYLLWDILGIATLAGFAVMVLLLPLNTYISAKLRGFHVVLMKNKDERIKFINEILNGIKVLKLYAWEKSFERVVAVVREVELKMLRRVGIYNAGVFFSFSFAPFMVSLCSFATYVLMDKKNILDAETAFVSISLFNILRAPLAMLPMMVTLAMQAWVSVKRINKFLNLDEVNPDDVSHEKSEYSIEIQNGSFSWGDENNVILKNINLKVGRGKLVAIVGKVGCGKSSLLSALLGEMEKIEGTVNTFGATAYVPQQAWIQNASLVNNILFGKSLNDRLYQKVLTACALQSDIAMLPGGDQTEIGEKGINLSGGQKQRVSIARAVYSGADVLILDDPLSAVDAHVGKHIFDNVVGPHGILNNKTRLLVTHGVTFLPEVDYIYVVKNGEISESGSYSELISQKGAFSEFMAEFSQKHEEIADESDVDELLPPLARSESTNSIISSNRSFKRQTSKMSTNSGKSKDSEKMKLMELNKNKAKLIDAEESALGSVSFKVYLRYFKTVGYRVSLLVICLNFLNQALQVGSSAWLTVWSEDEESSEPSILGMYLGVYGGLGLGQAIALLVGSVYLAIGSVYASRHVHADLLSHTLRLPMSFFDTTPLGRIINRFSKDVDVLDTILPSIFRAWMLMAFNVLSVIVVISYSTPFFILVVIPIAIIYYFLQKFYIATSRQLKRIESVTRSPIYSHFSETLSGQASIRAYAQQERFIQQSEDHVDFNQACSYPSVISQRWLALRLEAVGSFVILFAALFAVLGRGSLSPGVVGLSISYALQVTSALSFLVRMTAELESNIVAVERIEEYAGLPTEAAYETQGKTNPHWPEVGRVEFKDFKVRYREGLDLVLNGITFVIEGNKKVGIVGRTGAGKSSLTLALFRIVESAGGKIIIDGVDISTLGLRDLRSRLTIIPQDPVLFSGTIRMNIDPFEAYTDDQIWHALEHSYLKEYVTALPEGLQHKVSEGGENLSVGQRQLICLARALLRKTKVLILDEATAAIDLETDELIQKTIRSEFKDCTILTIAHRLNTIFDSDKVIVLDRGIIAEFDSPQNLLKNENGIFYGLARESGLI